MTLLCPNAQLVWSTNIRILVVIKRQYIRSSSIGLRKESEAKTRRRTVELVLNDVFTRCMNEDADTPKHKQKPSEPKAKKNKKENRNKIF